jgi:hypothetical protein
MFLAETGGLMEIRNFRNEYIMHKTYKTDAIKVFVKTLILPWCRSIEIMKKSLEQDYYDESINGLYSKLLIAIAKIKKTEIQQHSKAIQDTFKQNDLEVDNNNIEIFCKSHGFIFDSLMKSYYYMQAKNFAYYGLVKVEKLKTNEKYKWYKYVKK